MSTHYSTRATIHHPLCPCHLYLLCVHSGSDPGPCTGKSMSHFQRQTHAQYKDVEQKAFDSTESSGKRQSSELGALGGWGGGLCGLGGQSSRQQMKGGMQEGPGLRRQQCLCEPHWEPQGSCCGPLKQTPLHFLSWPCTGSHLVLGQGCGREESWVRRGKGKS